MKAAGYNWVLAIFLIVLSAASCNQAEAWRIQSKGPMSRAVLSLEVQPGYNAVNVGIMKQGRQERPVYYWRLLERSVESAWIAWGPNDSTVSVIICSSEGFSPVEHFSLEEQPIPSTDYRDADAALVESIRRHAAEGAAKVLTDEALLAWFCNGDGYAVFNRKFRRPDAKLLVLPGQ